MIQILGTCLFCLLFHPCRRLSIYTVMYLKGLSGQAFCFVLVSLHSKATVVAGCRGNHIFSAHETAEGKSGKLLLGKSIFPQNEVATISKKHTE